MYATAAIGYLELQEETLESAPLLGRLRALQLSKTHLFAVTSYQTSRTGRDAPLRGASTARLQCPQRICPFGHPQVVLRSQTAQDEINSLRTPQMRHPWVGMQ